jgi:NADH-quinone oxidoreductase subunit K
VDVIVASRALVLAAVLFAIGLVAFLVRRDVLIMMIAQQIMFHAAGLAFIAAGVRHGQPDGMAMFVAIVVVCAAQGSVGLALALQLSRRSGSDVAPPAALRG